MPNKVYNLAYRSLAAMVSSRAAGMALKNALTDRGESPDTVSARAMVRLLKGPIFREFQLILPRDGLKRNLNQLIGELRQLHEEGESILTSTNPGTQPSPQPAAPTAPTSPQSTAGRDPNAPSTPAGLSIARPSIGGRESGKITLVDEDIVLEEFDAALDADLNDMLSEDTPTEILTDPSTDSGAEDDDMAQVLLLDERGDAFMIEDGSREVSPPPPASQLDTSTQAPPSPTQSAPTHQATPPRQSATPAAPNRRPTSAPVQGERPPSQGDAAIQPPLSEERLEAMVLQFAQVEHVRQVAAMRKDGTVVESRGEGIDLTQLSRLGMMGVRLLRRSGKLRTYYLAHSTGQLFLLPIGQDMLVVAGSAELNVGEVFSSHHSLRADIAP